MSGREADTAASGLIPDPAPREEPPGPGRTPDHRCAAPMAIELSDAGLVLRWPDGESTLASAVLRAACRCAPCQALRLRGQGPAVPDGVRLVDARLVGHYALQLVFSDGHERGIHPWTSLRALVGRG